MKGSVWILARGVSTYDTGMPRHRPTRSLKHTRSRSYNMFTPRTRFSRASSLEFHCVPLNRIYGTTWTPATVKTPCATIFPFTAILNAVAREQPDVTLISFAVIKFLYPCVQKVYRSISAVGLVQMRYAPLHNYRVTVRRCSAYTLKWFVHRPVAALVQIRVCRL